MSKKTKDEIKEAKARRQTRGKFTVRCPYCKQEHDHSFGGGTDEREAPCGGGRYIAKF